MAGEIQPPIKFQLTLTGTETLLMHNPQTADPLKDSETLRQYRDTISIRSNRRTNEDNWEIARLEHMLGLYLDPDVGPYIPADNIQGMLIQAARRSSKGKQVETGVVITSKVNPLLYEGPRDAPGLWKDENFRDLRSIKLKTGNRITRCRPMFKEWTVKAGGTLDPAVLNWTALKSLSRSAVHLSAWATGVPGTDVSPEQWRRWYDRGTVHAQR